MKVSFLHTDAARKVTDAYCRAHFPDRYEKAFRYHSEADRMRSIGAGILLYEVLRVEEKEILRTASGKPYVPGRPCFSLSHSGNYVVLAQSEKPVGADIEHLRAGTEHLKVMRRVFTQEEIQYVGGDPQRFCTLWTLKESLSKAVGAGLSMPLKEISVLPMLENRPVFWENVGWSGYTAKLEEGQYTLSCVSEENMNVDKTVNFTDIIQELLIETEILSY